MMCENTTPITRGFLNETDFYLMHMPEYTPCIFTFTYFVLCTCTLHEYITYTCVLTSIILECVNRFLVNVNTCSILIYLQGRQVPCMCMSSCVYHIYAQKVIIPHVCLQSTDIICMPTG